MLKRTSIVMMIGLGLLAASSRIQADDSAKVEGDLKAMQGEWVSKDDSGETTWKFQGDRLSVKAPGRAYEFVIKIKADAKPEKHLDFTATDDSPAAKGSKAAGIYKFDGEKLMICFAAPEADRPREFKTEFPNSFTFELKKK